MAENSQCAVCGGSLPYGQYDCPACGITGSWQRLLSAAAFARHRFALWAKDQQLGVGPAAAIDQDCAQKQEEFVQAARQGNPLPAELALMFADECWHCRAPRGGSSHCAACGAPVTGQRVEELLFWTYTCRQIKAQCDAGRLPLVQAHACMNDAKSRIAALRNQLERDRVAPAAATKAEKAAAEHQPTSLAAALVAGANALRHPRRPLWEMLLDPRTIQWLLGLGGALFTVGLIIWLATLGIFKDPLVVAVALGVGNGAVLAGGWAIIRFSRYQTAGRAITLLASLVMPLNLWFYHANDLVTLDQHLWVAAVVCCVLYLASALVLRDHLFVYVLNGGIAMTGLLMLADVGKFWEIASPAAMLVVMGLIALHVERAFPEIEGPFSRRRFGTAFFHSGQVLLAVGLLLILGAQIAGDWLYKPLFEPIYQQWQAGPPAIVAERWGQFLALALVLAGSYAYFYSDIVVRRVGLYVYLAVFTLLWAEILVIDLVQLKVTAEAVIIALAITGLAANVAQPQLVRWQQLSESGSKPGNSIAKTLSFVRAGQPLGLFLSTVPVLLGLLLHLRATYQPLNQSWPLPDGDLYVVTWSYVAAMLITAVSCRLGAHLHRHSVPWLSSTYFFGTAAATLTGLAGLLTVLGVRTWDEIAPLLMIVPILYMIAARFYRGHSQETPLVWAAQAATGVMIAAVLAAAMHLTPQHVFEPQVGKSLNLLLAAFFAEAALFYALAAAFRKQGINVYLATAAATGALWQLLQYWQVGAEYYTLVFALLGLGLLVCYRLAMLEWTGLTEAAFQCANALMSLSLVSAALITLSRMAVMPGLMHWSLVWLLLALAAISLLAAWMVKDAAWRRWYIVAAIAEAALMFLVLHLLSQLTLWQKLEIFCVIAGSALLAIGHVGWYREQDQQSDLVSFSLLFGSLLVGAPLTIAVLIYRGQPTPVFSTPNELGMLLAGILMLATGFVLQLRATTITGAVLTAVYLITLILYINALQNVQTAAIWLTIGGATLFVAGILLSVYRDRLLTLPEKVKRREGVFRVLSWR